MRSACRPGKSEDDRQEAQSRFFRRIESGELLDRKNRLCQISELMFKGKALSALVVADEQKWVYLVNVTEGPVH